MFGFVRRSTYDQLLTRVRDAEWVAGDLQGINSSYGELDRKYREVFRLCGLGGVDLEPEEIETAADAVKALIDRVYVAASVVAENEKLNHFNRGMLAEREAAKSRHAA